MMPVPKIDRRQSCRDCGADITDHARYTNWTQCSHCYWKARFERGPSVESIVKQRSETKHEAQITRDALTEAEREADCRAIAVRNRTPWWRFVSDFALEIVGFDPTNKEILAARRRVNSLRRELTELESLSRRLESDLKTARHVRKRFDSAVTSAARQRELQEKRDQREQAFDATSRNATQDAYDRNQFEIRKQDYKRGNGLDNHFRNGFHNAVLSAFQSSCLICGSTHDLTLDHFAIPKNEGGNFVLLNGDRAGIRMNVVVLCRSCNSAKGETLYRHYFDAEQLARAEACQKRLLKTALADEETMGIIRSWYRLAI